MTNSTVSVPARRLETARLAMRYLSRPSSRRHFGEAGLSRTPFLAVEWETQLGEVRAMLRVQDGSEKVAILIRRGEDFEVLLALTTAPDTEFLADKDLGPTAQIGMVWEALSPTRWSIDVPATTPGPAGHLGAYSLVAV